MQFDLSLQIYRFYIKNYESAFLRLPAKIQFSLNELKEGLLTQTEILIDSGLFYSESYDQTMLAKVELLLKRWAAILNLSHCFSNTGNNLNEFLKLYYRRNKLGLNKEIKLAIIHAYLIIQEYVKIPE